MSAQFTLTVTAGRAKVYPNGQGSAVEQVLQLGESIALQVPVGDHAEPHAAAQRELLAGMAAEDQSAPAAGVDEDAPREERSGSVLVAVQEGSIRLRTYDGAGHSEKLLEAGSGINVPLTESNRITLAVYDARGA